MHIMWNAAQSLNLFFDPLVDEQPTSSRKRAKTVEPVLSLEQKVVSTAALSDAERFSEIPYVMEGSSNANDCHNHAVAGGKRKHEALEVDEEDSVIAENEVLWRANFEKLVFCLKKFCAERKKAKLKLGTHPIWEAFFEANVTDNDKKICDITNKWYFGETRTKGRRHINDIGSCNKSIE
uniref:DNA-directed RNA polymerase III 62 kDa polypeptide, putative n=1 Tax=Arundo donax TaxID=35708 RepID=A0A0A9D6G5_ARUDO